MTINIPSDKGKPSTPIFKLTGTKITDESTNAQETLTSSQIEAWVAQDSLTVTAQDVIVMAGSVTIEIEDPDGLSTPTYSTSGDFQGPKGVSSLAVGSDLEIFYTLNGKDPKRTANKVYTGSFDLGNNRSGGDNTIIKARSYRNGVWSDVAKVEIRIARTAANNKTFS